MLNALYESSLTNGIAVTDGKNDLSYKMLWERSEALAWFLRENYPDKSRPAAIFGDKENDMLTCMFAAIKAGKPYIAIPSFYPAARINNILNDSRSELILHPCEKDAPETGIPQIGPEKLEAYINEYSGRPPVDRSSISPDDIALIIYTSGSTGAPKGVQLSYRNLDARVEFSDPIFKELYVDGEMRGMNLASYAFSASAYFIYGLMARRRGTLYGVPKEKMLRSDELLRYMTEIQPNFFFCTPTLIEKLLDDPDFCSSKIKSMRYLCLGGEAFPTKVGEKLLERFPDTMIYNGYGCSETYACGTGCIITPEILELSKDEAYLPINIYGTYPSFLADKDGAPIEVKDGNTGEFIIYGDCVSPGYLGHDDLTAKVFYTLKDGQNAYKTHDIGKYKSGYMYFCGRQDNQVKIGGNRIELEDVEANMNACSIIANCAAAVKYSGTTASLVAFAVLKTQAASMKKIEAFMTIKKEMRERVESHVIPQKIIFLDELPKNFNGKLDRDRINKMAQEC